MILDKKMYRSFRLTIFASLFAVLGSCSQHSEQDIGDYNFRLVLNNRPAEVVKLSCDADNLNNIGMADLNLYVNVTCSLKDVEGYTSPQAYTIPGNEMIERQLAEMLDPDHSRFDGVMPVQIEYRTTECKSVRILLYNEDEEMVTDLTDLARFGQVPRPIDWLDLKGGILINSDGNVLGTIPEGCTIQEYLAYHPMVFASAHFVFPGADKKVFVKGSYIKIEIELTDGTICAKITST